MNLTVEDVKQDENAKDYINLSHIEMPLPDIDDMSEYESIGSEAYKNESLEKVQEAFDFIKKVHRNESL